MNTTAQKADVYFAIADPTRRHILSLVTGKERAVNDLVGQFQVSQPAISQHLKILRDSGLVTVRKQGRGRWYRINFEQLKKIKDWVSQFEKYWDQKMDALEDYLNQTEQ
mgnify:CR=1 FL=1